MNILTNLIDSLSLRLKIGDPTPSPWFLENAPLWRAYKESYRPGLSVPLVLNIPGAGAFRLFQAGRSPYEFVFINPEIADLRLWNPDRWGSSQAKNTGQIFLAFRSNWLFYNTDRLQEFLGAVVGRFSSKLDYRALVSRIDLCCDFSGRALSFSDLDHFVSRARTYDAFNGNQRDRLLELLSSVYSPPLSKATGGASPRVDNKGGSNCSVPLKVLDEIAELVRGSAVSGADRIVFGRKLQTVYIGRLSSPIYCRLYDKNLSLDLQGKQFLREEWRRLGWNGSDPVWRCEFSLSGDFLKSVASLGFSEFSALGELQSDLRELSLCLACLPELWAYCSRCWLRHVQPDHSSRSRSSTSKFWESIQSAFSDCTAVFRVARRRCIDLQQLEAQVRGCLLTHAARFVAQSLDPPDLGAIAKNFTQICVDWVKSRDFLHSVADRVVLLGLGNFSLDFDGEYRFSDSHYSASVRSDHLAMFGSS